MRLPAPLRTALEQPPPCLSPPRGLPHLHPPRGRSSTASGTTLRPALPHGCRKPSAISRASRRAPNRSRWRCRRCVYTSCNDPLRPSSLLSWTFRPRHQPDVSADCVTPDPSIPRPGYLRFDVVTSTVNLLSWARSTGTCRGTRGPCSGGGWGRPPRSTPVGSRQRHATRSAATCAAPARGRPPRSRCRRLLRANRSATGHESPCAAAARGGHRTLLQWLRTVNDRCCDRSACAAACTHGGHLDCTRVRSPATTWPSSPHAHYLAASRRPPR